MTKSINLPEAVSDLEISNLEAGNLTENMQCDWLLINNSNQFFLEYLPPQEQLIKVISGFSGSNAILLISKNKIIFFTDGRYLLQAKQQIQLPNLEIIDIATTSLTEKIANSILAGEILRIDGDSFNISQYNKINDVAIIGKFTATTFYRQELLAIFHEELIKETAKEIDNQISTTKTKAVFFLTDAQSGENTIAKRSRLLAKCQINSPNSSTAILINHPEDVAWILNLRGQDLAETPIIFASMLLLANGTALIFVASDLTKECLINLATPENLSNSEIFSYREITKTITAKVAELKIDTIITDENLIGTNIYQDLATKVKIQNHNNLVNNLRSVKNPQEVAGAITAHKIDAVAVIKFLHWLEDSLAQNINITEISASNQLENFRKENEAFFSNSFPSISGFAKNGAIIHYHSSPETNVAIAGDSLYLIDSGGQYCGADFIGTTDITRTIAIGNPSLEMIEDYTRVLKGHIALASAKFPKQNVANQFDILARYHLWNANKNYEHGTGHGVGSFLGVHEGPFAINKRNTMSLVPNLILSNEPGFYYEGHYGIRLENLMVVTNGEEEDWLEFNTITLVPFDEKLINFKMLTYKEKLWLKRYYQKILSEILPLLPLHLAKWLQDKADNLQKLTFTERF
jgi:Xaa-Pro aminopeptidase